MGLKSPADRQVEAQEDVERLACAFYREFVTEADAAATHDAPDWPEAPEYVHVGYRNVVERLLHKDVIRVGKRPNVERPMTGQTTIDDETGHLTDEDKAVGADGK